MSQDIDPCPDPSGLGMPSTGRHWTADDIPDLSGQRALVTGGAGGLGLATARALAEHGAEVIIADVNRSSGEAAAAELPGTCEYRHLDLASLQAIREFAAPLAGQPLDILINIAGIYPPARRAETADGFELKFGLNYLGHFALTAHLLPALQRASAPRVVSVSSITQAWGKLDFDDPQAQKRYQPDKIYARTKLACLMFGLELHERARAADSSLQSMVAHPGIARTTIGQERKEHKRGLRDRMEDAAQAIAMRLFGQEPAQGALPMLYAATAQEAESGGFYGPHGLGQFSGYPVAVTPSKAALDAAQRQRLWQLSEDCTGVSYRL